MRLAMIYVQMVASTLGDEGIIKGYDADYWRRNEDGDLELRILTEEKKYRVVATINGELWQDVWQENVVVSE